MESNEYMAVQIFKALGDVNRIRILRLLCGGERCACSLLEELSISQPTLSHHMKILVDTGLVKSRREGKWMHYRICCESARTVRTLLQQLLSPEQLSVHCPEK